MSIPLPIKALYYLVLPLLQITHWLPAIPSSTMPLPNQGQSPLPSTANPSRRLTLQNMVRRFFIWREDVLANLGARGLLFAIRPIDPPPSPPKSNWLWLLRLPAQGGARRKLSKHRWITSWLERELAKKLSMLLWKPLAGMSGVYMRATLPFLAWTKQAEYGNCFITSGFRSTFCPYILLSSG